MKSVNNISCCLWQVCLSSRGPGSRTRDSCRCTRSHIRDFIPLAFLVLDIDLMYPVVRVLCSRCGVSLSCKRFDYFFSREGGCWIGWRRSFLGSHQLARAIPWFSLWHYFGEGDFVAFLIIIYSCVVSILALVLSFGLYESFSLAILRTKRKSHVYFRCLLFVNHSSINFHKNFCLSRLKTPSFPGR